MGTIASLISRTPNFCPSFTVSLVDGIRCQNLFLTYLSAIVRVIKLNVNKIGKILRICLWYSLPFRHDCSSKRHGTDVISLELDYVRYLRLGYTTSNLLQETPVVGAKRRRLRKIDARMIGLRTYLSWIEKCETLDEMYKARHFKAL